MARLSTVVVDLDLARRMCAAARREATGLGALVSVAVVDAGGHLVAFERMDDAEIAGPVLARDKAYTAVAHRCATADLAAAERPRRRAGRPGERGRRPLRLLRRGPAAVVGGPGGGWRRRQRRHRGAGRGLCGGALTVFQGEA